VKVEVQRPRLEAQVVWRWLQSLAHSSPVNSLLTGNLAFFGAPLCSGLLVSHREDDRYRYIGNFRKQIVTGQSREVIFCSRRLTRQQLNLIYRPVPGAQKPSCLRRSDQRRGRFLVSLSKVRSGGWRPSRMASRMSGARNCATKYAVQVAAVQPKLPGQVRLAHRAFVQQSL
jgi:hypothetical protein